MTSPTPRTPLDPASADFALDEMPGDALHGLLRAYREAGPIVPARFMGQGARVIAGHDALDEAFRDEASFPGHRMYQASFEPAIGASFISDPDPASHLRTRKLATPAFRSRAVSRFSAEGIAPLAHELLDGLADRDHFDLVTEFTARLPYLVITRLLGLPREREEEFHAWALALLTFRDDPERALEARAALSDFLAPVVEARRADPRDDVISELVASEVDGRRLRDEEVFSHVRLLFPTGGETTHGSLGNLLSTLFTHEDQWQRLVADPSRIERTVAEGLRYETPIAVLPRRSASAPTRFRGHEIPPDTWVLFAIAGANRDPDLVTEPDRFDPDREQPPNLVFGRGPKSCPGLHLARRNMEVALGVLTERLPRLALEDEDAAIPRRTVLRSPDALHVRRLD
ncbi:unnamed protein product [Discosporangium mesarthrocarpum]